MEVAEVFGKRGLLCLPFLFHSLERILNLASAPRLLVGADDLLAAVEIFLFAEIEIDGDRLIIVCDLRSEIAAARVNDKILVALVIRIDLNEMIAAAERAETSLETLCVSEVSVAAEKSEVESLAPSLPDVSARGDEMISSMGVLKILPKFIVPSASRQQGTTVPSQRTPTWSRSP